MKNKWLLNLILVILVVSLFGMGSLKLTNVQADSELAVVVTATPVKPTATPTPAVGTKNINPLTGLPADDPALLNQSPVLVSISNFPISVRPQGGLSFAPHVFEMSIGEGMTRFLAVFYGSYGPKEKMDVNLGSIRSGRLPYEDLRTRYDGMVVMAGADPTVGSKLNATVFREKINFEGIAELAEERTEKRGAPLLESLDFSPSIQPGGLEGKSLEIFWSYLNRVRWTYDAASGTYLREQDKSDGKGTFFPATDKLTEKQLAADNVVLMDVEHTYISPTKIDMEMLYVIKMPAIFLRDGKAYKVYWTSLAPLGPFHFVNEDGTPFPYKPGNTWYEVISNIQQATQKADGSWYVRFFNP
jgi:hypothetical protein